MSDTYGAEAPNITVNVPPAPVAPEPASPITTTPMASEADVDRFLGQTGAPPTPTSLTPASRADPSGGNFATGLFKGVGQDALGALSLLPGIGHYFSKENWPGTYAPSRNIGESVGTFLGEAAPYFLGGELIAGARATPAILGAIRGISPTLARAVGSIYGGGTIRAGGAAVRGAGGRFIPGTGGAFASRYGRPAAVAARSAIAGGVAGATRDPGTGDPNANWFQRLEARAAPAAAGAVTGATLGIAGPAAAQASRGIAAAIARAAAQRGLNLTGAQTRGVSDLIAALGGAAAGGLTHSSLMAVVAMYGLHNLGLGVRAAHSLAPSIAAQAVRLAQGAERAAFVSGAEAGDVANDIGRQGPR